MGLKYDQYETILWDSHNNEIGDNLELICNNLIIERNVTDAMNENDIQLATFGADTMTGNV